MQNQIMVQAPAGIPTSQELMVYQTWAKTAVDSQMYRGIGKEAGVMMIMLAAREFGIGPAQALNGGLNIIEGKVELSARMMSALIRRAGHELKITEGDNENYCKIWGKRKDTGEEHEVKYTIEMAQKAGLIKEKGAWKKMPEDMLYNRAMSRIARRLFADVIGIGYIQGEISELRPQEEELESLNPFVESDLTYDDLLQKFDENDRPIAIEFFEIIMKNYAWSKQETVNAFMKDFDESLKKFNTWKSGRLT